MTFEEYAFARTSALVRLARLLTGDEHRAEDLVQDVLALAYARWGRIARTERPDAYVRRMLVNAHHSWWRRRGGREISVAAALDRAGVADEATAVAGRVRFDGARRCVVPFRLRVLPPGGRLLECSVTLGRSTHGVFAQGSLVAGDGSGRWLTVRAQPVPGRDERPADLVAGPYRARRQGGDVLEMFVEPCVVEVFLAGWGSGYPEPDGLAVLGGYRPAGDLARPDTW